MIKMKELMEATGESKSTLLYYLKEGLLPEPKKPKPNVHLYDEKSIKIVKFIKYLQEHLSYSIAQIKEVFASNSFNFDDSFEMIVASLEVMSGTKQSEIEAIFKEAKELGLDENLIKSYQESATKLAKLEFEAGKKLLKAHSDEAERVYKLLFDVILTIKPHIFNQATIKEHKERFDG